MLFVVFLVCGFMFFVADRVICSSCTLFFIVLKRSRTQNKEQQQPMINTRNQNNAQRTNNTNTEHDQNQKHNFEEQNKTQYKNNTKEEHI